MVTNQQQKLMKVSHDNNIYVHCAYLFFFAVLCYFFLCVTFFCLLNGLVWLVGLVDCFSSRG